jgi:hypothetical protein
LNVTKIMVQLFFDGFILAFWYGINVLIFLLIKVF